MKSTDDDQMKNCDSGDAKQGKGEKMEKKSWRSCGLEAWHSTSLLVEPRNAEVSLRRVGSTHCFEKTQVTDKPARTSPNHHSRKQSS